MRHKKSQLGFDSKNPNCNEQKRFSFKKITLMNQHKKAHQKSLICCSSSEALIASKTLVLKILKFRHVKLFTIKAPLRAISLLFLTSIYIFSYTHYKSLYLYIIFLTSFVFFGLIIFKNAILKQSRTHPQVVWSIGSTKSSRYEEEEEESKVCGYFVKVYSNGDVYEGEFNKGKCNGSGVYYYNMNGRYEGDWVDQKYDGYGVETWAKGSRYRGQYRQGLRHGYGIYRVYIGDMYAGEWLKGVCHGYGVHTCEDGSKYFGEFKGGVKHGIGHYHFRNGDMYAGEYFADKMHGFGVYSFSNGHRYEGGWHEGRRQGFGMYTFRNGDTQSGHWEDGILTISTAQDTISQQSPMSISHAKVLKAVEEARRIAEKAVGAANMEDKVNRTVAAANRAANAARVAAVKAVQRRTYNHIDDPTLLIV
uniref:phosphatidylinositol 4-phosphate 5-kinase 7-like n=1 Tax=Erigeron canadensis TaxID=72917 RepID=UPI001CB96D63|nr:phosphatidylinositol 4-phosphate 5-kinase 7-like [Erigeron canadensis]